MKLHEFVFVAAVTSILAAPGLAFSKDAPVPIAVPAPPAGKGQIVWFRPGGMGFAIGCSVNEKGQKVSSLGAGRYFIQVADPGRHEFTVKSEAKDVLALEVESDETQYAACKIKAGIMMGRPDISPSSESEFRSHNGLKMVDAEDMGPGEGALRAEQVAAALAAATASQPAAAASDASPGAPAADAPSAPRN